MESNRNQYFYSIEEMQEESVSRGVSRKVYIWRDVEKTLVLLLICKLRFSGLKHK